jgi:hypothetical protein
MTEQVEELRSGATARGADLLAWLTSMEPGEIPELFVDRVGELKGLAAKIEGKRMGLETLKPLLEKSREFDERLEGLGERCRERMSALVKLAAPLVKRALQAMRRGDLKKDDLFQPLIEAADNIVELKRRIGNIEEGKSFWERGKARAETLFNQGKLKLAQFKLHSALKKEGKGILKAGDEERYRCELTEEILGRIKAARISYEAVKDNQAEQKRAHGDLLASAVNRLAEETVEATSDLESLEESWTKEQAENLRLRDLATDGLLAQALAPDCPDFGVSVIDDYRAARKELDELCLASVRRIENVDWPAATVALGESRERCPEVLSYLRGVPAFDKIVIRSDARVGLELCEKGVSLCLLAVKKEPFVGLLDESIVSVELEDMQQIFEKRRGNVVADSLVGFVTGGVKGAVMRGASGMKEREVAVDMPDLVMTLMRREPEGGEQAIHLALSFDAKAEVTEFFETHFGSRFRLAATAPRKSGKSAKT